MTAVEALIKELSFLHSEVLGPQATGASSLLITDETRKEIAQAVKAAADALAGLSRPAIMSEERMVKARDEAYRLWRDTVREKFWSAGEAFDAGWSARQ